MAERHQDTARHWRANAVEEKRKKQHVSKLLAQALKERDAALERAERLENQYWDRCAAGEDPESVAQDFPELERTHRNISAQAAALVKVINERDQALKRELRLKAGLVEARRVCHEYGPLSDVRGQVIRIATAALEEE